MKIKFSISLLIIALVAVTITHAQETNQTTNTITTATVPTELDTSSAETDLQILEDEQKIKSPESPRIDQYFVQVDKKNEIPEMLINGVEKDSSLEFTEIIFNVSQARLKYQIELNIKFSSQVSFGDCVLEVSYPNDTQRECIEALRVILKRPDAVLKIYRRVLTEAIIIKYRLVISGCDNKTQIKRILYKQGLPPIVHDSNLDCLYQLDMREEARNSIKFKITGFPSKFEPSCRSFVQISRSSSENDLTGIPQAFFNSMDTIKRFNSDIVFNHHFALIKMTNCYDNSEPIVLEFDRITRNVKPFTPINGKGLISPTRNSVVSCNEISGNNSNSEYDFAMKIVDFHPLAQEISHYTLILYAVNAQNQLVWYRFTSDSAAIPFQQVQFKAYNTVYLQYTRAKQDIASTFVLQVEMKKTEVTPKKLLNPSGLYNSRTLLGNILEKTIQFEIVTAPGTQISLNLTSFNTGLSPRTGINHKYLPLSYSDHMDLCDSTDFIMVHLKKQTQRLGTLYNYNTDPKICNSIQTPQLFKSFSNRMNLTVSLSNRYLPGELPFFNFEYSSEKVCEGKSKRLNDVIKYSSLESRSDENKVDACVREIEVPSLYRIIMYRKDWKLDEDGYLLDQREMSNHMINGRIACKGSDVMRLAESLDEAKNQMDFPMNDNVFCMSNPLNTFVSKDNKLYMYFEAFQGLTNRPLVFETGYFAYRHLYNSKDSENIFINFADIIPVEVPDNIYNFTTDFEIRFEVPDTSASYFMPVLHDCNLKIASGGKINVKTSSGKEYILSNKQCGLEGTVIGEQSSHITFMFQNIDLNELRKERIKFGLRYKALPRVLTTNQGSFHSNNFTYDYLSRSNDLIQYEWSINLAPDQFIQFNIDTLTNQNNIKELFIIDNERNVTLYDLASLLPLTKRSFLFATSKITVRFSHSKNIQKKLSLAQALSYIECSYEARPRVIQVDSFGGQIQVANLNIKDELSWFLVSPRDFFIVVKIKEFENKGQLKFSLLNNNYNPSGVYHYDRPEQLINRYDEKTTVFVSKDNTIDIKYLPSMSSPSDRFSLDYSIHRKVITASVGILKPIINNLVSPVVFVPKQTEQKWTIRAPYQKTLSVYYHFIDLLAEDECSKSSIKLLDDKNRILLNVCNRRTQDLIDTDLKNQLLVKSTTNEITLSFQTHNYNDIVYSLDEKQVPVPFKGYELFYTFDEQTGDCYFQKRSNLKCGYTDVSGSWSVALSENQIVNNYKQILCLECYLKAEIPFLKDMIQTIESPLISRDKKFLRFLYKLTGNGQLFINMVYEQNGGQPVLIPVRSETLHPAKKWRHATINLGTSEQEFRIQFTLKRNPNVIESVAAEVNLDDIQLFSNNFECESNEFPEVCSRNQVLPKFLPTSTSIQTVVETPGFCKKNILSCHLGNTCLNGAICLNQNNTFMCLCPTGFTGLHCETKLSPCDDNKCKPESTQACLTSTTADPRGYTCKCSENFHGEFCQKQFTPCKLATNPCNQIEGHGTCIDTATMENPTNYTCSCSVLYSGPECEVKRQIDCASDCQTFDKLAQCDQINGLTVCLCSAGFRGDQCQFNIDDCDAQPCLNNATCVDGINTFTCDCGDLFTGKYCEKALMCDKCSPVGTLHCDHKSGECLCEPRFKGQFCEKPVDPCLGKPCLNEGQCFASSTSPTEFKCFCPFGFTGERCEIITSECDKLECLNGGLKTCQINNDLDKPCNCTESFTGRFCETYLTPCDSEPCRNDAFCSNTIKGAVCHCQPGFTGATCEIFVDTCKANPCNGHKCLMVGDSYVCMCELGYIGKNCELRENSCAKNFCQNGVCVPNDNDYSCQCHEGYNGKFCDKKINQCDGFDCNNGKCIDKFTSHECLCPLGTAGFNCQPTKYCSLEATECSRNGTLTCLNIEAGNRCNCQKGYGGNRCELLLNACEYTANPCHNSGKCVSTGIDEYKCVDCSEGFTGPRCEKAVDKCEEKDPCLNGAKCLPLLNDYFCQCSEGFTGKNCSIKVQVECAKNNCKNNGTCVPNRIKFADSSQTSGYSCECGEEWEGMYCEKQKDLCKGVSCDYGFCEKGVCRCDPRLPYCDKDQKCLSHTCENGGTCIDVLEGEETKAKCLCPPGMTGENCELSVYCEEMGEKLCGAKERCKVFNGNYRCDCELPAIGYGCKSVIDDLLPVFVMQLKSEKVMRLNEACRFGFSKQSQLFIGTVLILVFIFTVVSFISGHRVIKQYRIKMEEVDTESKQIGNNFVYSDADFMAQSLMKTPKNKTPKHISEITGGFSIPRPSVRTFL